ncbi:MAG: PilT/PilU family type 4a pilus ATPase [Candidatus Omnitrophica bacterium]|nr:PilT/PilU family type 4a pilus ATPase [Candidatus Omnitrophota bacterium]
MTAKDIFEMMIKYDASDVFIRANSPLKARIYNEVKIINEYVFCLEDLGNMVEEVGPSHLQEDFKNKKGCEFTICHEKKWRFRFGVFYQRGSLAMVIRKIGLEIPTFDQLSLPGDVLAKFCTQKRGLILLTGVTGSGKSTAIASMVQYINQNFGKHILTIEEPIEFTYIDDKSIVNQRELGKDVFSYDAALTQFALHSPDVIFIGNIRDEATCRAALTAAETGVLVFSTLHTVNAASTVERIIDFFPPHQQSFVLMQLSVLLKGVMCLRLLPRNDQPGLIPAYEVMTLSPTVSRLLRENKLWEVPKYISSGEIYGMKSFDQSLLELVKTKKILPDVALEFADKKEELELYLRNEELL